MEREAYLARRYAEGLGAEQQNKLVEAQRAFADVIGLRPDFKDAADRLASLIRNIRAQPQAGTSPLMNPPWTRSPVAKTQQEKERVEAMQRERNVQKPSGRRRQVPKLHSERRSVSKLGRTTKSSGKGSGWKLNRQRNSGRKLKSGRIPSSFFLVLAAAVIIGFLVVLFNTGEFPRHRHSRKEAPTRCLPVPRLSSIAQQAYGDTSLASALLSANRDKLPNWSSLDLTRGLPDGISLYIPSKHAATILSQPHVNSNSQSNSNSNSPSCDTDTQGRNLLQGASQFLVILNRSAGLWRYFSGVGTLIRK